MKKGKAVGPPGIVLLMFMADEDCSMDWLASLCNFTISQGRIPDDWKSTILLPVCKGKGDPMECGKYRQSPVSHNDKVTGRCYESDRRVFERRIRDKVKIDAMQFKPV